MNFLQDYVDSGKPNAVNTSFAMLALIYAGQVCLLCLHNVILWKVFLIFQENFICLILTSLDEIRYQYTKQQDYWSTFSLEPENFHNR
jgi:hypothetical protein